MRSLKIYYLTFVIFICQALAGCGYDFALIYKDEVAKVYDLKIEEFEVDKANAVLTSMFDAEGVALIQTTHNDVITKLYSADSSSYIRMVLLKHPDFGRLSIVISPARFLSSENAEQYAKKEDAVFRIQKKLIESGQFSEYYE